MSSDMIGRQVPSGSRRSFLKGSAVAVGGLVVPFSIPFGVAAQEAAAPEINAWVVVKPDDTIVIRIARSEMGQGTLTGLAQLVGEELDADWSNITTEYPTPTQNLARNRVWGSFSTGGSRGIRESHEYVRKGGAIARTMLVQAAADAWKVPPSECSTANSRITHVPSGRTVSYGSVAQAASRLTPPTDVKLKDPRDWKLAGQADGAAGHGGEDHRGADIWHGPHDAGHGQRRHQGLPRLRRQGRELRRRCRREAARASGRWFR
jgi:isoquinoline 1-oxidoreductase beta subunit